MKIAILTSGILPVPAVQGGAVENLTDFYLEYNHLHQIHDITVYSIWHPEVENHNALKSNVNHYYFINTNGIRAKLKKKLYEIAHGKGYYHYSIEYYLHESIKVIKKQKYDIIIIENRPGYALKLKEITKAKLVYHLHNEKLDIDAPHCQEIYDAAWRILTVSDYIKFRVQTINVQDTKTLTVYNGINLSSFNHLYKGVRSSLGFCKNDFIIVFSGRVNRDKGIMELIKAIDLLKEKPLIKLMVIGGSFFGNEKHDDFFMKELKTKATKLKNRIVFTGFIPYSQMPNYLSMADIAVIPSVWDDPFPTTILEAQAMGLPIITTHKGGIPEEVTKENAILLHTDGHFIDNLANAILDLYEHPEKREIMAAASKERSKLFDKDIYANNFFKALDDDLQVK